MTCDHTIGQTFDGRLVTVSEALEDAKISQMQTYKFTGRQEELKCWVVYRFEYCPRCGTKIDWADIRRKFKEGQGDCLTDEEAYYGELLERNWDYDERKEQ